MSVDQVAERCAKLGAPELTANAIYLVEGGRRDKDGRRRRHITVDELLTLAAALYTSPLAILLPGTRTEYPLTSSLRPDVEEVYRWILGQRRQPGAEADDTPDDPWTEEELAVGPWFRFRADLPWVSETPPDPGQLKQKGDWLKREISNVLTNFIDAKSDPALPSIDLVRAASEVEEFLHAFDVLTEEVKSTGLVALALVRDKFVRESAQDLKKMLSALDETEDHLRRMRAAQAGARALLERDDDGGR